MFIQTFLVKCLPNHHCSQQEMWYILCKIHDQNFQIYSVHLVHREILYVVLSTFKHVHSFLLVIWRWSKHYLVNKYNILVNKMPKFFVGSTASR